MTFLEMKTYVQDRLVISTDDSTRITMIEDMINNVYRRLVAELGLLQGQITLYTLAGDPDVNLPVLHVRTRALRYNNQVLQEVSWQQFANLTLQEAPSDLAVYAMKGYGTISLWPTPSEANLELELWYDELPTPMGSASDEPDGIPEGFHEIIPEEVIARVAMAEEEPGLAQVAKQLAAEMRMQLIALTNRRSGQRPMQQPVYGLRPY